MPDEVVAQLCDAIGLIGTPAHCADRIAEMAKLGVRNLYLMPFQTFVGPEHEIAAFRDVVFPRLPPRGRSRGSGGGRDGWTASRSACFAGPR